MKYVVKPCEACGQMMDRYHNARFCWDCCAEKTRNTLARWAEKNPLAIRAQRLTQYAVKLGFLPVLDGSIPCADCGEPAKHYDHRDYTKPLDVEPVCARCNKRRGAAHPYKDKAA